MRCALALLRTLALLATCLLGEAHAHALEERYGSVLGAFLHPLLSLDHGLALLALGFLASQNVTPQKRLPVLAVVAGLFLGASVPLLTRTASGAPHWITLLNVASLIVLGALVAAAPKMPPAVLVALATFFGLSHGVENGLDLSVYGAPAWSGLPLAAAGLVTLPLTALVTRLPEGWPRVAVRVGGSWIAAIGLIALGFELRFH